MTLLDRLIERLVDAWAEGDMRTTETLAESVFWWAERKPEEVRG